MNKSITFLVLILLIIAGMFYWYEVRPMNIRKYCNQFADHQKTSAIEVDSEMDLKGLVTKRLDYDKFRSEEYNKCISDKGLRQEQR